MATRQTENDRSNRTDERQAVKRRGLIAGAAALVAGVIAKAAIAEETVSASTGSPLLLGLSNSPTYTADTTDIRNPSTALAGNLYSVINFGTIIPSQPATSRIAIAGLTSAVGATGTGDTTANLIGVYGGSDTGNGLYGDGGSNGVYGNSAGGNGVYGNSAGSDGNGVSGISTGNAGNGVYGYANGGTSAYGVWGSSGVGYGVYGSSGSGPGVYGTSATNHGVSGFASGTGTTFITAGLFGTSNTTYGIIGHTTAAGYSGLTGTTSTPGVAAMGGTATVPTAYAAYFTGKTVVAGDFYVVGGGKFAAVAQADGSYQGLYCTESPEPWFEDFGTGKIVGGTAEVTLDPEFAALIHTDTYHVFVTAHSDQQLHVPQRTPTGFHVAMTTTGAVRGTAIAAGGETFSWRVVGKRKDIAGTRLPRVDLPKINHPDPDKLPPMPAIKQPPAPLPPAPPSGANPVNPSHKGNP